MTTQIRKSVKSAVQVAAVGLLSLVGIGAWAEDDCAQKWAAPALMGQLEVTASPLPLIATSAVASVDAVPMIGRMTVTATRLSTVAGQPASTGEPAQRTRSPRAVLVQ